MEETLVTRNLLRPASFWETASISLAFSRSDGKILGSEDKTTECSQN